MGYKGNIYATIEDKVKDPIRRKIVIQDCQDWLRNKIKEPQTKEMKEILKDMNKGK